jgi:rhodanese-related sulfurtransferase
VTIEEMLQEARGAVQRPGPVAALAAQRRGALLIDTRPETYRATEGEIPGSLVLERNVLEWRLDPSSSAALPIAGTGPVIVICNEGYASSLAAASLRSLGLDATDLAGGYRAWRAHGLPMRAGAPTPTEHWVPQD